MTPEELIARYQATYGRLRADTVARATAMWLTYGGPGDANVARFVPAVVPMVSAAQAATARLVSGYVALMTRLATGSGAVDAPPADVTMLRGVSAAELYTRPVITMRSALAQGKDYPESFELGRQRVAQLSSTDVLLAQRAAALHTAKADRRIVGWRRVTTAKSCPLCSTASGETYGPDQPMPIHHSCDCGVAPIYRTVDPGRAASKPGQAAAGATTVAVHQHGELGPVLTDAAHHFSAA